MPLTIAERKHRMPTGARQEIADELGIDPSYVTRVMADEIQPKTPRGRKSLRRIQVAIARKIGVTVDEAFPPQQVAQVAQVANVA